MKINRREMLHYSILAALSLSPGTGLAERLAGSKGKPQNRLDVHHHIIPEFYLKALASIGITSTNGAAFPHWTPQRSIEAMDRNDIQKAITSFSAPGIFFNDIEFTIQLARQCNEFTANLIAKYPKRFGGFAVLPLPDVEASLAELTYALDSLKLNGVILLSNIAGDYLGSTLFDEVFVELNSRKAVVFIHPTEPHGKQFPKMNIPPSFFEFVFDTTRTVASLIQRNSLERFPDIGFIIAHGGGAAPYLAQKMALTAQIAGWKSEQVVSQLGKLFYDTALCTSRYPMALLKDLAGVDNIVFGSDYGFAPEFIMTSGIYELDHGEIFDKHGLEKIYTNNAKRLFERATV